MDKKQMTLDGAIRLITEVVDGYVSADYLADVLPLLTELRKRLEWQPMETCPHDLVLLKTHGGIRLIGTVREDSLVSSVYELAPAHEYSGWMPLPEVE